MYWLIMIVACLSPVVKLIADTLVSNQIGRLL